MPKITFTDSSGTARTVDAENGSTVMETAIKSATRSVASSIGSQVGRSLLRGILGSLTRR